MIGSGQAIRRSYSMISAASPESGQAAACWKSAAADIPADSAEIQASSRFGPTIFRRYEWEQRYSTANYLDLLLTYSGHRALEPVTRSNLLACIAHLIDTRYAGHITKRYLTELRVAHRHGT